MAELQWGNLQSPNIAGNFQSGYAFGTQVKQQRQAEQDQNMLRGLAPQIIAGDAGAYDQAAAINPEAANAYQGAGDNQLRRLKGFINYVDQARATGNTAAVDAALQAGSGFIGRFIGKPGPTAWTPDMAPGWEQLKAKVAMMDSAGTQGRVQSTYVDGDGNRVAIMADGTQKVLGANDAGMSQQTISIPGPDGRPRQYTFDKRTGNYVPAGEGGQSSALGAPPAAPGTGGNPLPEGGTAKIVDAIAEQANRMIAAGIPAEQVDAWAQSQQGAQPAGAPASQMASPGPSPFVGRSPEEQAALTEAAKLSAQNANFGNQFAQESAITGMKTQAELDQAREEANIKTGAEIAGLDATRSRDAASALALLDEAEKLLPGATGSGLGAARDAAAGYFGTSTSGAQATAALKTIAGQLTSRMPRMQGPQSDKDVQLYKDMAGDLANDSLPVPTRLAALQAIRRLNQEYAPGGAKFSGGQQQSGPQPGAVQRARNPQTGEVLELRNGQWVPAQ